MKKEILDRVKELVAIYPECQGRLRRDDCRCVNGLLCEVFMEKHPEKGLEWVKAHNDGSDVFAIQENNGVLFYGYSTTDIPDIVEKMLDCKWHDEEAGTSLWAINDEDGRDAAIEALELIVEK